MLEELGVQYEIVPVDLRKGEQRTPDFLKINPMGAVPALKDGDTMLFESGAIVAYLADKFPEKKFAPAFNTAERAKYYQWLAFAMATLDNPIVNYYFHTDMYPPEKRSPAIADAGKQSFFKSAKVLSEQLNGSEYLVGNQFSAADILVGSNLIFAKALRLLEEFPLLQTYVKRLTDRPAFQRSLA